MTRLGVVPPDVAAWICASVLPEAYRRNTTDPAVCACQWGACGHCRAGRHADCTTARWGSSPTPETYVCGARGLVVGPALWRSGRPCRWVCSCSCSCTGCRTPAPSSGPVQLDLFAGVGS